MGTSTHATAFTALRVVLEQPHRDVVGIVDDVLKLCHEHRLELDWHENQCRVRRNGGTGHENGGTGHEDDVIDTPFGKSVFRGILARVAVLCNERCPNSVSPFGGKGQVFVGAEARQSMDASFANTRDEQWFKLSVPSESDA